LLYLVAYPGLGSYEGKLAWSSKAEHANEMNKADKALEPLYARYTGLNAEQVAADASAMAIGERLFMNNCAQCHGSDARGSKGFPNLADADWLHGGTPDKIKETLVKGRVGNMPPMAAAVGTPDDVKNVAHYVLSLSGSPHDSLRASLGKASSAPAPPATASTARATRPWAPPT
jgi:cytochrome c oxidase cbb3-type subunit 3